ncbi:MAG: hypothetical protein HY785_00610 [Oscillatoriophycideae cyanobacterium NC_groundwater_1537_Pr4_S-0.65um_50_18]|nr:hypothetical protein [Oscillatoriophycideae cyanobacterium NC_groundwater_1537_Pr4_S-0.65um_50_18]
MEKEFKVIASTLRSILALIWDTISTSLSDEPRIWQKRDRFGEVYWHVYDPIRDRHFRFTTEQEVRQWLEQKFSNL